MIHRWLPSSALRLEVIDLAVRLQDEDPSVPLGSYHWGYKQQVILAGHEFDIPYPQERAVCDSDCVRKAVSQLLKIVTDPRR